MLSVLWRGGIYRTVVVYAYNPQIYAPRGLLLGREGAVAGQEALVLVLVLDPPRHLLHVGPVRRPVGGGGGGGVSIASEEGGLHPTWDTWGNKNRSIYIYVCMFICMYIQTQDHISTYIYIYVYIYRHVVLVYGPGIALGHFRLVVGPGARVAPPLHLLPVPCVVCFFVLEGVQLGVGVV